MDTEDPISPPHWPRRSRCFLRIGKVRFVPILLFVKPPAFSKETLDIVLSILYDKIPNELVLDPHSGQQIVAPQFHAQRPSFTSTAGLSFYYYWTPTPATFSMMAPKDSRDPEYKMQDSSRDALTSTNMTLILCVLACPSNAKNGDTAPVEIDDNHGLSDDMSAIVPPSNLSRFLAAGEQTEDSHIPPSSQGGSTQSNPKKRKR